MGALEELIEAQAAERKVLEAKLEKLKKNLGKDKKKNKTVNQEIEMIESELEFLEGAHTVQREELTETAAGEGDGGADAAAPVSEPEAKATNKPPAAPTAAATADPEQPAAPRVSKAQKRREKKEREAREREQRIADAEPAEGETKREQEYAAIWAQLEPLKLTTTPIKADGHCLFKAVSVQLAPDQSQDVDGLRQLAATELRKRRDQYQPFLLDDNGDILTPEKYDAYCDDIEKTAKWGGQCELLALSTALQRPIKVFQAGTPPQDIGAGGDPILLSFHQHEWSLGAHYNAVIQKR